jgi:hypothetical protein
MTDRARLDRLGSGTTPSGRSARPSASFRADGHVGCKTKRGAAFLDRKEVDDLADDLVAAQRERDQWVVHGVHPGVGQWPVDDECGCMVCSWPLGAFDAVS